MRDPNHESLPRTVKFLVTDRCNISCNFCHNEFQGNRSQKIGAHIGFDESKVTTLLTEISESSTYPIRVKISGGEPLLFPDQVTKLMKWSAKLNPQASVLMSNLAPPAGTDDEWLANLGFSEARLNVPTLFPREYSELTGNFRLPLPIVFERCSRLRSRGLRIRLNAVIDEARIGIAEQVIANYLRELDSLCIADEVVFIVDARYLDQAAGVQSLTSAVASCTSTTLRQRDFRRWGTLWRGMTIGVARCIMWRTDDMAKIAADIYIKPPGVRHTEFEPGRASRVTTEGRYGV